MGQMLGSVELPGDEDLVSAGSVTTAASLLLTDTISLLLVLEFFQHDIQLPEALRPRALAAGEDVQNLPTLPMLCFGLLAPLAPVLGAPGLR